MASAIDETKPIEGSPTTQSVRDNFFAAKNEIEALQSNPDIDDSLTISSEDSGAASGPVLDLYRNSSAPLADDLIGRIDFSGMDTGASKEIYAQIFSTIIDPTNVSEKGSLTFATMQNGALTTTLNLDEEGKTNVLGALSVSGLTSMLGGLELESQDGGALQGPELSLYRNSPSPATNDVLGALAFDGETDEANKARFAQIRAYITDPVDGVESGALQFATLNAGTLSTALTIDSDGAASFADNVSVTGDLTVDTDTLFVNATTDRVGVNTVPDAAFHAFNTGTTSGLFQTSGASSRVWFSDVGSTSQFQSFIASTGNDVVINVNGGVTEAIRINSSGNVGIGTNAPQKELEVSLTSTTGTTLGQKGGIQLYAPSSTVGNGGELTWSSGAGNTETWAAISGDIKSNSGTGSTGDLVFATKQTDAATSPTEAMRITKSGNVGIGATSPNYNLHVNDTAPSLQLTAASLGTTATDGLRIWRTASSAAIWNYEADPLLFATSGTERMRIDSSGNVGIGVTTAGQAFGTDAGLTVDSGNSYSGLVMTDGVTTGHLVQGFSTTYLYNQAAGSMLFGTSNTEQMRISSSGNVGIGTSSPGGRLELQENTNLRFDVSTAGNPTIQALGGADNLEYKTGGSGLFTWTAGSTERMRIDSSGNLLVGKNTNDNGQGGFAVLSTGRTNIHVDNSGTAVTQVGFYNGSGTAAGSISSTGTTTQYNTASDVRLKENITDADSSGSVVDALQVRQFDWKAVGSHQRYGFVAQELDLVYPEAVTKGDTEEDTWGVDYSKLVPLLVKEIQELKAEVAALKGGV